MKSRRPGRHRRSPWVCSLSVVAVTVLAVGCAPRQRSDEAVWARPASPPPADGDPAAARPTPPPGYSWTPTHGGARGGDAIWPEGSDHGSPRGDLPETALITPHGIWRTDERRAWQEARELGLGLVVQFWAEWSVAAVRLERETLQDPEVVTAIEQSCVALKIDVTEETIESREQLSRYQVHQLPMVILLDSRGREHQRFDSVVASRVFLQGLAAVRPKP